MIVNKYKYVPLPRVETSLERLYATPTGNLPSVTTILSHVKKLSGDTGLDEWRNRVGTVKADKITKVSASVGTLVHKHVELHILQEPRPIGNNNIHVIARKVAQSIIDNGLSKVDEVWGTEVPLYCPGLYAGTADAIGVWNGRPAIFDFKNTRSIKNPKYIMHYFQQLSAYAIAHNEVYGTDIRTGVIMMACRGDTKKEDLGVYQQWIVGDLSTDDYSYDVHSTAWLDAVKTYYDSKQPLNT
jgi:hypothetical protein